MADRRMFNKAIVLSDEFLDMSATARCLYFTLSMFADDDGFINNPKSIIRQCSASQDDLKLLISKAFVIPFETGIIVIRHWRINNYLRSDRYTQTQFQNERQQLEIVGGAYELKDNNGIPAGIPTGIPMVNPDKNRLDKIRIDKIRLDNTICPEPCAGSGQEEAVYRLILNDKTYYGVTQSEVYRYKQLYPAVNIEQEFRNMEGWCENNPTRRKTKSGIKRFVNSWLAKEQNKGGSYAGNGTKTYRGNTVGDPVPIGSGEIVI